MKRLILTGGGHAHLHVLKSLVTHRWPDVEILLISPYPRQIYSGMVPGWMSGHYTLDQCSAALAPLVRAAGVRFIQDRVTGMAAGQRLVHTARSGSMTYDVLSLDTGAEVDCACLAASGARLLPIRPLESFIVGWQQQMVIFKRQTKASLAVVGGGAAGVELALAARFRLAQELNAENIDVQLIAGAGLLPGHGHRIVMRVERILRQQRIGMINAHAVGSPEGLQLNDGRSVAADCVIAATGVQPARWLAESGLALAPDGFVAVGDGQQSTSHPAVFAAGDVASRVDRPHVKSGVHAVRAGPVLTKNLQRALMGYAPLTYQPQRRNLYLLATGPKEAVMSWGGLSASGHWVWKWKDWIDRRFMRQYDPDAVASLGEKHGSA